MRNTKNIDRTAWKWRNITLVALDNMSPPGEIDYYVWTDELNLRISEALSKEAILRNEEQIPMVLEDEEAD